MDRKTIGMSPVTVTKGSRIWAYSDHKNHWKLVDSGPGTVTICHAQKGGEVVIEDPDRVLVLETDENGWSQMRDMTNEVVVA